MLDMKLRIDRELDEVSILPVPIRIVLVRAR